MFPCACVCGYLTPHACGIDQIRGTQLATRTEMHAGFVREGLQRGRLCGEQQGGRFFVWIP